MRAMAFGHLVPARPEDPGRLARHAEKQGLLLSLFKHPRRCHTGFPQPTEGRAESEAEKMCGSQEGGKSQGGRTAADSLARNAVSRRSGRVHEGPPPGQNARQLGGVKIRRPHRERDRMAAVSRAAGPRQFPLRPYTINQCRHLLNHARFPYLHGTNRTVLWVSLSTFANASITYLISSSVFHAPSENRTEQWASAGVSPIASNACEGSGFPDLHAEPEEKAIPLRSRKRTSDSPRISGMVILSVFGRRSRSGPFLRAPEMSSQILDSSRSRSRATLPGIPEYSPRSASSTALPKPTIPGTFSVPERIPCSCPPPFMSGSSCNPLRTQRAPTPLGPCSLWAETA